ncbi:hypothetical protein GCM10007874_60260 [Labrys miyagiensis]|uniref:Uncharacterized protein n=1 Tax=Labrys miyagiensis TaxID=346912 RepID=A0ABQ6CRK1_9HYPH|nr:hypothetical protein GCM10007874_60260 [Labrys miyagiensis]
MRIVDAWSRYIPNFDPRFSYRGKNAVATLVRCAAHLPPSMPIVRGGSGIGVFVPFGLRSAYDYGLFGGA